MDMNQEMARLVAQEFPNRAKRDIPQILTLCAFAVAAVVVIVASVSTCRYIPIFNSNQCVASFGPVKLHYASPISFD